MRRILKLVALFLSALTLLAHDAYDHSTILTVSETRLELTVTMGGDAAVQFLSACGINSNLVLAATRGSAFRDLPTNVASKLFEVSAGGKILTAEKVSVFTAGLETPFIVVYLRPEESPLNLRALFFNGIEPMKRGTFVAEDENGKQLASAFLSRENDSVQVALPPKKSEGINGETPTAKIADSEKPETAIPKPSFYEFFRWGVERILGRYNQLLFLCALLLVCRRAATVLPLIICFTIAHSITLVFAALDWVNISPHVTETLIAVAIIFAGVENFRSHVNMKTRCGLALCFGLIQGFAFANELRGSGLGGSGAALVKPLFASDLGMECGQLAVAALFLPVLLASQKNEWFARNGVRIVSTVVVALGVFWLVERIL